MNASRILQRRIAQTDDEQYYENLIQYNSYAGRIEEWVTDFMFYSRERELVEAYIKTAAARRRRDRVSM